MSAGGTRRCVPCRRGTAPLSREAAEAALARLPGWVLAEDGASIGRRFEFRDFDEAFALVSCVAELARREDHHPDVAFGWGYARLSMTTHAIGGLHENDMVMAGLIDAAAERTRR